MKDIQNLNKGIESIQDFNKKGETKLSKYVLDRLFLAKTILTTNFNTASIEELQKLNEAIYEPVVNSNELLFDENNQYDCLVACIATYITDNAFKNQFDIIDKKVELMVSYIKNNDANIVKKYYMDMIALNAKYYIEYFSESKINNDIVFNNDLSSPNYLYKYGEYISDNELKIVNYFNSISQSKINEMAKVVVDGFIRGYNAQNLNYHIKDFVTLFYPLGFEKMALAAYELLKKDFKVVLKISNCTNPNKQYDFFHRNDKALYVDSVYVDNYLNIFETAFRNNYDTLKNYGGALWIETFGEKQIMPNDKVLVKTNEEYTANINKLNNQYSQLYSKYTNSNERSFTIISYPCPDIGDNFETIFDETIKINTLDCDKYEAIQQKIIDALDMGDYVHITGSGNNKTDLIVQLHKLSDPKTQTNFENCTADVNIPVGEVFTSPVLKGTTGKLYVGEVYLRGLKFTDLEFDIKDGMIVDYNCSVFKNDKDNKDFIKQNILNHYETLPMGEFAIGTNTLAYMIARKYHIEDKLDILIAEKTGPHFAFGDTCFSHQEEVKTYNPNGKEIIAKENEVSALRHEDMSKAYFGCHTDITIPFDELQSIKVISNNNAISIIENGLFVLDGTQELNIPLTNK